MNHKYFIRSTLTLLVFSSLLLAACGATDGSTPAPASSLTQGNFKGSILVGGIFDLSGSTLSEGYDYAAGVAAYTSVFNSRGGANGYKIELKATNSQSKAPLAIEQYQQMVKEGVVAVVAYESGDTQAITRQLSTGRTPLFSTAYEEDLVRDLKQNPYNFMIAPSYTDQIKIALLYAKQNRPDPTRTDQTGVGYLYTDDNFGRFPYQAGRDYASAHNISWYHEGVLSPSANRTNLLFEGNRLRNAHPEYTFVQARPEIVYEMVNIVKAVGVSTQLLGLGYSGPPDLPTLALKGANGYMSEELQAFPDSTEPGIAEIRQWLTEHVNKAIITDPAQVFPNSPLTPRFIQGWATMKVLLEGIRQAVIANPATAGQLTGDKVKEGLESISQLDMGGITPPVSFSPTRHKGTDTIRIMKVESGKWKTIGDYFSLSAMEYQDSLPPPSPTPALSPTALPVPKR